MSRKASASIISSSSFCSHYLCLVLVNQQPLVDGERARPDLSSSWQVAVQLALLISKVARFDYPREWYVLFQVLLIIEVGISFGLLNF